MCSDRAPFMKGQYLVLDRTSLKGSILHTSRKTYISESPLRVGAGVSSSKISGTRTGPDKGQHFVPLVDRGPTTGSARNIESNDLRRDLDCATWLHKAGEMPKRLPAAPAPLPPTDPATNEVLRLQSRGFAPLPTNAVIHLILAPSFDDPHKIYQELAFM